MRACWSVRPSDGNGSWPVSITYRHTPLAKVTQRKKKKKKKRKEEEEEEEKKRRRAAVKK
jgi:hypothetical protein